MRGATDPNETLGAQQLKTQYGSTRIRDKQQELVRLARDLVEITTEILSDEDKFDDVTLIEMSQTQLPTQDDQKAQIQQIQEAVQQSIQQVEQAIQSPQTQQMLQQNPQSMQQVTQHIQRVQQQAQQGIAKILEKPTIEQVLAFIRNARAKAFTLDIETDSTIEVDENADKQRRAEFIGVLSQMIPQLSQLVASEPAAAPFAGELLKFAVAPYRVGRSLDTHIDALVDAIQNKSGQQKPDDPETVKTKALVQIEQQKLEQQKVRDQADADAKNREIDAKSQHEREKLQNNIVIEKMRQRAKEGDNQAKIVQTSQKMAHDRENHQMDVIQSAQDMENDRQKLAIASQQQAMRQTDMAQKAADRRTALQQKATQSFNGGGR